MLCLRSLATATLLTPVRASCSQHFQALFLILTTLSSVEEVAYLLNKYPVLGERGLPARRKSRAKDPTQPRKAANKGIQSSKSKEMIDSSDEDEDEDFEIQRELVLGRSSGRTNYADGSSSEDEDEDEDDE